MLSTVTALPSVVLRALTVDFFQYVMLSANIAMKSGKMQTQMPNKKNILSICPYDNKLNDKKTINKSGCMKLFQTSKSIHYYFSCELEMCKTVACSTVAEKPPQKKESSRDVESREYDPYQHRNLSHPTT